MNSLTNIYSEVEIPYSSDFEGGEGYVNESPLSGDWTTTDDSVIITDAEAYSGTQSVLIAPANPENIMVLPFNPSGSSILFVDYYMQLTASALPELPSFTQPETSAIIAVQPYLTDSGEWVFLDGDGSGSGLWRTSEESVPLDAADRTGWHRITLRFDLLSNSWDAYINGRLLAVNLGFIEALIAGSEAINIYGNSADVSYVDTFSLTATNPLFNDEDLDGMEDDFEVQNGLDASVNDRDSDLDGDGLSNIEEYRLGFDPSVQDVDTVVNLPTNGALTVVDDVDGNVRITNDGVVLLDKPISSIYNLSIFGGENSGDIDILLDGTLNGVLEIEGDVGTVTFNSLLTILGGLKIKNVENLLLHNMLEVHDDTLINVSNDFKLDFFGSLVVVGGDLDGRENMRDPGIKGDFTVSSDSKVSVIAGSAFLSVSGAIQLDGGSRFAVENVSVAPGDMPPQLQLNSSETITISDNSSIHSSNNTMSLSAQEHISLVNNSAISAAENGFVSIQANRGDLTVVDSEMSLENNNLFLYVQGILRVIRSSIDVKTGIAQFIVFVDAIVEENSSMTVTGGDLYGQINRNLTVSDNSEIAATDGNLGLNVIGNALIEGASRLKASNLEISGDNAESVAKKLQLIVSGTTTFDSGSTLALENTELVIFSFDNIDLFDSTLSVFTGTGSSGDIEASIRTNGNLSLTESTLSMDGSNLFVNAAKSMYIIGSEVTATDYNFYLNTRIDTIMDVDSTLSVTGGDLYANIFGKAILGGIVTIENVFSAYVQGNFTLTETGSLDAFTILLSSGRNISIDGRMDTWMGTSQGDGRVFMNAQGSIYMKSLDPITAGELFAASVTGIFLRTDVDSLTAQTTGIGLGSDLSLGDYTGSAEIEIYEDSDVVLKTIYNADGPIRVMAGGTIQAGTTRILENGTIQVGQILSATDAPGHNIGLISTGGDIEVGFVKAGAANGQVSLSASGTIRELAPFDTAVDVIGKMAVLYAGTSIASGIDDALEMDTDELYEFENKSVSFDTIGDVELFMSTGSNTIDISSTQGDVVISHATSAVGGTVAESPNGSVYIGYLDSGVVGGDEIFVTMSEDGVPNDFELVLKSTDLLGDNLNWSILSNAVNGVASVEEPAIGNTAVINYLPELNFYGNDSFVVRVADQNGNTEDITVKITIESVNDLPTAPELSFTLDEGGSVMIDLLAAATDIDSPSLSIDNLTQPDYGTLTDNNDGTVIYTHNGSENFSDSFEYTLTDSAAFSAPSVVSLTINPVNDPPTANDIDNVIVDENAPDSEINLFAAFTDIEDTDQNLIYTLETNTNAVLFQTTTIDASSGILTLSYMKDTFGSSNLTVRATDSGGLFVESTFNVTVNEVIAPVLSIISGNEQVGNNGQFLLRPLVAQLTDDEGVPMENVPVNLTVSIGGSLLALDTLGTSENVSVEVLTDSNGLVFGFLRLIGAAGEMHEVRVSVPSLVETETITFNANLIEFLEGVTSEAFGGVLLTLPGVGDEAGQAYSLKSLPLIQPNIFAGCVVSLENNTLTDTEALWKDDQFNGVNGSHYVSFTSGIQVDIVDTNETDQQLILAEDISSNVSIGDSFVIRRHFTIADVFGSSNEAGLLPGTNVTEADTITFYHPDEADSVEIFFSSLPGSEGWRTASLEPATDFIIAPGRGWKARLSGNEDLEIPVIGVINTSPTQLTIEEGLSLVGTFAFTRSFSLSELNLSSVEATTGLVSGDDATTADALSLLQADGSLTTYFLRNQAWFNSNLNPSNAVSITPGSAFFIERKAPRGSFIWTQPTE